MNGKLYTGGINVLKIDKSKLSKDDKGRVWLNLAFWVNEEPDEYGNHVSIQQQTAKDEDKIYLGNAKRYLKQETNAQADINDDDLPF